MGQLLDTPAETVIARTPANPRYRPSDLRSEDYGGSSNAQSPYPLAR